MLYFKVLSCISECLAGLALLNGICLTSCPEKFYVSSGGHSSLDTSSSDAVEKTRLTYICLPCHYSCKTCSGPSDFHCLTCHDDANLHRKDPSSEVSGPTETHCYPTSVADTLENNYIWYKAIILTLVSNLAVVVCVAVYIWKKKQARGEFSNGPHPNGQWYRARGGSRPYRRISPDEDDPPGDYDEQELGETGDSADEENEFLSDSHDDGCLVEAEGKTDGRISNKDLLGDSQRSSDKFFKQNIVSLHSHLSSKIEDPKDNQNESNA
jgi:hypothetical protein